MSRRMPNFDHIDRVAALRRQEAEEQQRRIAEQVRNGKTREQAERIVLNQDAVRNSASQLNPAVDQLPPTPEIDWVRNSVFAPLDDDDENCRDCDDDDILPLPEVL